MHGKEESQFMWSGGRLSPESTQDSADRGKEVSLHYNYLCFVKPARPGSLATGIHVERH